MSNQTDDQFADELLELTKYIEDLHNFLPTPYCFVTASNIVLDINNSFSITLGYKEIEIIGNEIYLLFESKQAAEHLIQQLFTQGAIESSEVILVKRDGKNIVVYLFGMLRKDTKQNIIGYYLSFIDITAQNEIQNQLVARNKDFEAMNNLMINRELKMIELKKEIEQLKNRV